MVWIGLEGCDGTGKSSLAEAVAEELERRVRVGLVPHGNVELSHKGPPEKSVLEEYATDVEGRERDHLVFDRWHMGELVYPALYRDQGPYGSLGLAGFRWVEKFLQARGARFYVVDLPYPMVKARLEARGEDYLQSHHVEHVLKRFREVSYDSILTQTNPFIPRNGVEYIVDDARAIVSDAVMYASHAHDLRDFPSYVGPRHPRVLLVGEKRGGQPPFASQACFMPLKGKSGEFLWAALPEVVWRHAGAVNAVEDDVPELLERFAAKCNVVALGREASKILTKAKIPHGGVPHPAKVRRFNFSQMEPYGSLITHAAATGEQDFSWPN